MAMCLKEYDIVHYFYYTVKFFSNRLFTCKKNIIYIGDFWISATLCYWWSDWILLSAQCVIYLSGKFFCPLTYLVPVNIGWDHYSDRHNEPRKRPTHCWQGTRHKCVCHNSARIPARAMNGESPLRPLQYGPQTAFYHNLGTQSEKVSPNDNYNGNDIKINNNSSNIIVRIIMMRIRMQLRMRIRMITIININFDCAEISDIFICASQWIMKLKIL